MTEIETIYNIIHNATYNDIVLLEIELSKPLFKRRLRS